MDSAAAAQSGRAELARAIKRAAAISPQPAMLTEGGTTNQPVTPKLPRLSSPQATSRASEAWLRDNYSNIFGIGPNRENFFKQIHDHINPGAKPQNFLGKMFGGQRKPNFTPQYTQHLDNKFQSLMNRTDAPLRVKEPQTGSVMDSNVQFDFFNNGVSENAPIAGSTATRTMTLPNNPKNQYFGQNYFGVAQPTSKPISAPKDLYAWGPAMPRSLIGIHERQHTLQNIPAIEEFDSAGIDYSSPRVIGPPPSAPFLEPAAVMSEMAHASDAAYQATGKPVPGQVKFAPRYAMDIDEMRREAERAGVLSGKRTAQEAMNTPAGQAWMKMQLQQYDDALMDEGAGSQEKQNSLRSCIKRAAQSDLHARFQPDYTPEQLEHLGVYDALYRNQAPRLASLGAWKPEWVSEHDPKGWAQWYKRYAGGRRIEGEDARQIKRWLSFKARHGGPFSKNPTARRGWALRNWAIDPSKLAPGAAQEINDMLDEHQRKAMQKYVKEKVAELLPEVSLQPHQQRVADRVTDQDPRLLVYHGLGSGKSLSALAAAEKARGTSDSQYGIVVPASLRGNFQKEVKKFTRGSSPEILSYTGLALGKKFKNAPDTVVMDEAQRLKNPESATSRAAQNVAAQAKRLLLLTGTPITNSPTDLASLISLLNNEKLTPQDFEKRFIGYKKKFPGVIPYLRGAQFGEEPYVKNEKELRRLLAGKVDYQPSKTPQGVTVNEEVVKVPLSPEQQKIQKAVRTTIPPGFLWKIDKEFPLSKEELSKLNAFMTGLRQVSLSTQPFRADANPLKAFDQSSKLRAALSKLRDTLDTDPRRKAIIYSNFIDAGINPYAAALEREQIPYGVFHGGIPTKTRQQALQDYNTGKLRALLLGPAAAEGISTKGTSLIQLLDPYWHESRTQQARGRGLRFDSHEGLPEELKNVAVQRYLSASQEPGFFSKYLLGRRRQRTGDEVMQTLADRKEALNEAFRKILQEVGTPSSAAPPQA